VEDKSPDFILGTVLLQVALSYDTNTVGGLPESVSLVNLSDRAILEIHDLSTILQLFNDSSLTSDHTAYFSLVFLSQVHHREPFRSGTILDEGLDDITIWHNFSHETFFKSKCQA
jgi:hypothetical protein